MTKEEILDYIDECLTTYNNALESYIDDYHYHNTGHTARVLGAISALECLKNKINEENAKTKLNQAEDNTHDYVIQAHRLERKFDPTIQDYTWVTVESKTISILANVSATKAMDIYSEYTRAYGETNWQYSLERLDQ